MTDLYPLDLDMHHYEPMLVRMTAEEVEEWLAAALADGWVACGAAPGYQALGRDDWGVAAYRRPAPASPFDLRASDRPTGVIVSGPDTLLIAPRCVRPPYDFQRLALGLATCIYCGAEVGMSNVVQVGYRGRGCVTCAPKAEDALRLRFAGKLDDPFARYKKSE